MYIVCVKASVTMLLKLINISLRSNDLNFKMREEQASTVHVCKYCTCMYVSSYCDFNLRANGTGSTRTTNDLYHSDMACPAVIGLDLGTFNLGLRAAVFRDNRVELIKDELGNDSTPAFIGFNLQSESADNFARSATVLGRHAYDLAQRNLSHPVYGLKKLLGRKPDNPVIINERGN